MGTIPTVPTFTAGAILTAADLNALGTAINFWAAPPRVLVYSSSAQTFSNSTTFTVLTWNAELYDTDGIHSTTTNTSRLVCQTAGYYAVNACVTFVANSTGSRAVMIRVNGAGTDGPSGTRYIDVTFDAPTAGQGMAFIPTQIIPLTVGDYVEVFAWQNSGGNLNTETGVFNTFAQMQLVGKV